MERSKLSPVLLESLPWESSANPIWPASTFLLQRNIRRNNFPSKLSPSQGAQLLELLKGFLLSSQRLDRPFFLDAGILLPSDKEFLFEHFLCSEGFQNTLHGQGFIADASTRFLALLNITDHLQLQIIDCQGKWETSWNRLIGIETDLSSSLEYAYSPRFGYLTSDPLSCGTALHITVYLHLPLLIHTHALKEALEKRADEEVSFGGMQGDLDELIGDVLVLRNRYTLGVSEESILQSLERAITHFTLLERSLRDTVKEKGNPDIRDLISRSYGLLIHSYQLQTKEALNALSLMKLGIDLGWISGIDDKKVNEMFFRCRRAHLQHLFPEIPLEPQALAQCRAAFLHQALKPAQLLT